MLHGKSVEKEKKKQTHAERKQKTEEIFYFDFVCPRAFIHENKAERVAKSNANEENKTTTASRTQKHIIL